jgi:endonuclease/exonuclease/phosphatase family metal-dependent hydrolase
MSFRQGRFPVAWVVLLGLALAIGACDDAVGPTTPQTELEGAEGRRFFGHVPRQPVRFLTRNVYLGADIQPVVAAATDPNPLVLVAAATAAWQQIQDSRIADRAEVIARQIARDRPHMVGLQEAFRFVELDANFQPTGLVLDLLAAIENELADRGADYETVAIQNNTASALPVAVDPSTGQVTRWVSFTDRIAVLVRDGVEVEDVAQGMYAANVPVNANLVLTRGWIRVSTSFGNLPYHFVNTHLEGQSLAPVQAAQAAELRTSVLAGLDGVTVLVGDLNSDAEAGPGAPSWTPTYGEMIADGFTDLWDESRWGHLPGYTCCQAPDLTNLPSQLDERIDFVLVRSTADIALDRPGTIHMDIVGSRFWERTTGLPRLWPSDHAGLLAALVRRGRAYALR